MDSITRISGVTHISEHYFRILIGSQGADPVRERDQLHLQDNPLFNIGRNAVFDLGRCQCRMKKNLHYLLKKHLKNAYWLDIKINELLQ